MNMKNQSDIGKLIKKEHEGKWLAISPNYKKIIAYSEKLADLEKEVGKKDVVYTKALHSDVRYAF